MCPHAVFTGRWAGRKAGGRPPPHPRIQQATGRHIQVGRDDLHGRDADAREANFLGLRIGSPILAGAHRLWDDEGVIEYGEWCLPYRLVVGYEYSFEAASDAS
ncbi:hypothetical protein ACWY4P_31585 [Streptomyces sp. LZ34]